MSREYKAGLVILLFMIGLGIWIARNTYWDWTEITSPMKPVAAVNPNYSIEAIAHSLGARSQHSALHGSIVPPADALLVLSNISPSFSVGREARIRNWVEQGGRLLISADLLEANAQLRQWSRVSVYVPPPEEPGSPAEATARAKSRKEPDCQPLRTKPGAETLRICAWIRPGSLLSSRAPTWELRSDTDVQALRIQIKRGSLTVVRPVGAFGNQQILKGDNAGFFVRAAQLHAGDVVWFADTPVPESLLHLIWRVAAPGVAVALAGVLLLLWRMLDRLGPLEIEVGAARRSLREQIAGTGRFAWRMRDLRALIDAERRALDEAAGRRIRRHKGMDWQDLARAVAALGGLDSKTLEAAMADSAGQDPLVIRENLARLELARRRLNSIKERKR
jgi:hypothetical protein